MKPAVDTTNNIMNPSLTYDSGVLTFTFQRPRNTGDATQDWNFSDSDCYYFIYPVGGGPHRDTAISRHSTTPTISDQKICSKQLTVIPLKVTVPTYLRR